MTTFAEGGELPEELEKMEKQAKDLGDILRDLGKQAQKQRVSGDDIVYSELNKLMRQELASGMGMIASILTGGPGRDLLRPPKDGRDGGGISVVINNNASAAVTARETTGAFNRKQLEITIDQMVAGALMRGRQTTGVLGSLFNIVPSLSGR